jgi:hypothetical protein
VPTASLTWKLRQQGTWLTAATTMPAESATRVACTLVRQFAPQGALAARCTPATFALSDEVRRFGYKTDDFSLQLRLLKEQR